MFRLDCFLHGNCIENPRGDGKTLLRENNFLASSRNLLFNNSRIREIF